MRARLVCAAGLALTVASPAAAHHSAAMFDASKAVTIQGSVKQWEFTNPHSWLHVMVPGAAGAAPAEWSIEFGSPNNLYRQGIRPKSMVPGDKVTVTVAPLKDGSNGGQIRKLVLPDGKVFAGGGV